VCRADNLAKLRADFLEILGASTSWSPQVPVKGCNGIALALYHDSPYNLRYIRRTFNTSSFKIEFYLLYFLSQYFHRQEKKQENYYRGNSATVSVKINVPLKLRIENSTVK
jgi:hypothetical protein